MRGRIGLLCGLLLVLPAACSVIDDGKVQSVNPPDELTDTLPSTTIELTTTTEAQTTTTGLETTTTEVQAEPVKLYYISSGLLSPLIGSLSSQYSLSQLIAQLQAGPLDSPVTRGLRNAIPETVEVTATSDGTGVATVVLPEGFFDTIPAGDQRLAIAQIVMTLLDNTPGVGQVVFNSQVSGPSGELIPPGQKLTRADYLSLLASSTSVTPTTTTSPPLDTTTVPA